MDPTQFALWRFRHAEGVMDYIQSWNTTECVLNIKGKVVKIVYNPTTEEATISIPNDRFNIPITCKLSEFVSTMTKYGFYKERTINRHNLSYPDTAMP